MKNIFKKILLFFAPFTKMKIKEKQLKKKILILYTTKVMNSNYYYSFKTIIKFLINIF